MKKETEKLKKCQSLRRKKARRTLLVIFFLCIKYGGVQIWKHYLPYQKFFICNFNYVLFSCKYIVFSHTVLRQAKYNLYIPQHSGIWGKKRPLRYRENKYVTTIYIEVQKIIHFFKYSQCVHFYSPSRQDNSCLVYIYKHLNIAFN